MFSKADFNIPKVSICQPQELNTEERKFMLALQQKAEVRQGLRIDSEITTEVFVGAWLKFRESTSSSPSQRHYGHYKAAAIAARLPEDHMDYTKDIAWIHATMCSLPLLYGFSPSRWRTCIDAILEKIPGHPLLEKLRIIMLYEADFSYVLKEVWGRRLIRSAEDRSLLGLAQHGSRPGRQCTDAVLEKSLVYEISRLT